MCTLNVRIDDKVMARVKPHFTGDHAMQLWIEEVLKRAMEDYAEERESQLADVYERLSHLSSLKKGWDGRGALPVSQSVIGNVRKVMSISDKEDWEGWMISPDVNATLCLFAPNTKASISLGSREFSYFARKDGERLGESHVVFTPEVFLSVMRKLWLGE